MPNRLNIPEELDSLIEKREADDRRQTERRDDQGELAENNGGNDAGSEDRRTKSDRRIGEDRRE